MVECEDCKKYKKVVFRRADIPRLLCSDCYVKALLSDRPSQYLFVPSYVSAFLGEGRQQGNAAPVPAPGE
jgi:hypothetical protein